MVVSTRQSYQVIPLPAGLTSGGTLMLTLTTAATGNQPDPNNLGLNQLMSIAAGLYADTHFTMNQTPVAMRPLDSRDPAANCTNAPGNCNPAYTVQFTCSTNSNNAMNRISPSPILLASLDEEQSFLALARQGRRGSSEQVRPRGQVAPPPPCPAPPVQYQFLLAPQTQWLVGTSTNFGTDTADVPDYVFTATQNPTLSAPQNGGLSIATAGFVTAPQTVVVTSQDFGGVGQLRATATFQQGGLTFDADIVALNGSGVPVPAGSCGARFLQHPFASIPVDQDCNGIADNWEDQFSTRNGTHLAVDWDQEPGVVNNGAGVAGNSPMGDGYSVHDEYRGFHYVLDDGKKTSVRWISTDPMNKQDVFFWDPSNQFTQPLRQILDQQSAVFVYRRVNAAQAHGVDAKRPLSGANPLNQNSITLAKQAGYAVVYASDSFGQQASTLGETKQPLGNNGLRISIDTDAIGAKSAITGFPRATLLAQVVAHETGHRFGQMHPYRNPCCTFVPLAANQLANLTLGQVAFPGATSSFLYARLTQYTDPFNKVQIGDGVDVSSSYSPMKKKDGPPSVQLADSAVTPVYRVDLIGGQLTAPATSVYIQIQQLELMDWTPNLNLTMPAQWHFDAVNLNNLCVRSVCQR